MNKGSEVLIAVYWFIALTLGFWAWLAAMSP